MMFWFTVRPAIKEFVQRYKDNPDSFRIGFCCIECKTTQTRVTFNWDNKVEDIVTHGGMVLNKGDLHLREKRALNYLGKMYKKHRVSLENAREQERVNSVLNSINPEKLVKEND